MTTRVESNSCKAGGGGAYTDESCKGVGRLGTRLGARLGAQTHWWWHESRNAPDSLLLAISIDWIRAWNLKKRREKKTEDEEDFFQKMSTAALERPERRGRTSAPTSDRKRDPAPSDEDRHKEPHGMACGEGEGGGLRNSQKRRKREGKVVLGKCYIIL